MCHCQHLCDFLLEFNIGSWHLGTWYSGELGRVRLIVELDLLQPKQFLDFKIMLRLYQPFSQIACLL